MSNSPSKTLIVPVHLDALYLAQNQSVEGPLLDFSKIPWGTNKVNQPYLSEELTPSTEPELSLEVGTHLHWALPDALSTTMSIPVVRKYRFINVFGNDQGTKIWAALETLGWITPNTSDPNKTSGFALDPEKRSLPAKADPIITQNLSAIVPLLASRDFPPAPNRWLVSSKGASPAQIILESDYQSTSKPASGDATTFPVNTCDPQSQPYVYLGRSLDFQTWQESNAQGNAPDYLADPLTAVGFGEPAFAAFYPNCRGVFGYHDAKGNTQTNYELTGWYSGPDRNYFQLFVNYFKTLWEQDWKTKADSAQNPATKQYQYKYLELLKAVSDTFRWEVPIPVDAAGLGKIIPRHAVPGLKTQTAYGYLLEAGWIDASGKLLPKGFDPRSTLPTGFSDSMHDIYINLNQSVKDHFPDNVLFRASAAATDQLPSEPTSNMKIAIGNTGTEAMAALLASELSTTPETQKVIENHLEALELSSRLQGRSLDVGPKFEEARHEKGFTAEPGGSLWSIRAKSTSNNKASHTSTTQEVSLPDHLGDLLNELNMIQQTLDREEFEIAALRRRIFSDWHAFQEAVHQGETMKGPVTIGGDDPGSNTNTTIGKGDDPDDDSNTSIGDGDGLSF